MAVQDQRTTDETIDDGDDDEEVFVQGSVLQQVFSSFRNDFEVSTHRQLEEVPAGFTPTSNTHEKRIDPQLLELVKMLCTSDLMLEEDADALYTEDLEELSESPVLWTRLKNVMTRLGEKVWCCLGAGVLFVCGFSAYQALDVNVWSLFFESDCTRLKKSVTKLIPEIKQACDSVKKANSTIRIGCSTLNSKTVEAQFKLSSSHIRNHYYHRLEHDLLSYTKSYCGFVIDIVRILIVATKRIIGSSPHRDFYVATKLEDRLLLLNDTDSLSLSKVDELFNIFIITQSEYFRALGLFLTTHEIQFGSLTDDISSLVSAISRLRESSSVKLSRGIYSQSYDEKQILSIKQDDSALLKLDCALTSLLTETFGLKDYLTDLGSVTESDVDTLLANMAKIKAAVDESASTVQRICNQIRKPPDDGAVPEHFKIQERSKDGNNTVKCDDDVDVDEMAGGDRIYMCVIDDDENHYNVRKSDAFLDDESPEFPAPLMAELSFAVEKKRLEFEQRELEAIQKSDLNAMNNEFDLVVLHKPLLVNNPGKTPSRQAVVNNSHPPQPQTDVTCPVPLPRRQNINVDVLRVAPPPNTSEYSLRKDVAALAANKSHLWVRAEEDVIGDSDSSEDLSCSDAD